MTGESTSRLYMIQAMNTAGKSTWYVLINQEIYECMGATSRFESVSSFAVYIEFVKTVNKASIVLMSFDCLFI